MTASSTTNFIINPKYWQKFFQKYLINIYFPVLFWSKQQALKSNIKTIYFCSRDGYILYKAWKHLKLDNIAKAYYLPISRDAMRLYAAVNNQNPIKEVNDVLSLFDKRFTTKVPNNKLKILTEWTGTQIESLKDAVYRLNTLSKRYKKYLAKLGVFKSQNKAFFDIGWGGSVMYHLESFVGEIPNSTFFYIGLRDSTPKSILKRSKVFAFSPIKGAKLRLDIMEYLPLIEFIFSAPHGRFLYLDPNLQPVWDNIYPNTQKVLKIFEQELQNFVQNQKYKPFFKPTSPSKVFAPLLTFARRKQFKDLKEWRKVFLEINIDGKYLPFVPTFTKTQVFKNPQKTKKQIQKALWWNTLYIKGVKDKKEFIQLLKQAGLYKQIYGRKSRWYFKLRWILLSINWRNFKRFLRSPLQTLRIAILRIIG